MARHGLDPLEELLRSEAERLADAALQDSRQISQDQVEALTRLARVVEIRKSLRSPPAAPMSMRWAVPLVLIGTLGAVSLLLFTHVPRTEIELEVHLSEVGLRPRDKAALVEGADLLYLGVTGAQEISVRRSVDWSGLERAAASGSDGLSLEMVSASNGRGSRISLSAIRAGAATRAWIQAGESPRHVRLLLEGDNVEIQASLLGRVRLGGAGLPERTVDFKVPRPAFLRGHHTTMILDLTASSPTSIRFSPQIGVEALSLYQVRHSDDRTRRLSSILSGSLYFGALNGAEEKLRIGQELRLDDVRGEIRTIQLSTGSLGVQFHGYVGQAETGSYDNPRNLMPVWLEWLRARHGVSLLWGTALYVFGIILAALRWFSQSRELL